MTIRIPKLSLVALIGPSGSGKSTFARTHFLPTEVISSDACRGLVADDENDQTATGDAFEVLYFIARKRLAAGRLTVVDATNVRPEDRKRLVELAREFHVLPCAIVFDLPERVCQDRNSARADRNFGPHVIRNQQQALRKGLRGLEREGFRHVSVLRSVEDVAAATIERIKVWNDRREEHGPFDLIGDVHGCRDELVALLGRLGYTVGGTREAPEVAAPEGRKAVFVGDLVDRGPDSPGVLRLVMHMVGNGTALCVPGNHDVKLQRKLAGRDVRISHGLAETLEQLQAEPEEFSREVAAFIDKLVSHYVLDDGKLVVAHAGLKQELQGRTSQRVREFALYGETTGEIDAFGLPVRSDWARDYRGPAMVVYGHTPTPEPEWVNRTICLDTGCVFGGKLTALRYPEKELVSVAAAREYYAPVKPLLPAEDASAAATTPREALLLDLDDVAGKRVIDTRAFRSVTIREENSIAALEVMSRFAIDPRWLVYLPPTMAPPETAKSGDLLERPQEALDFYRQEGIATLVCEEKHMGSRAVVVLCRDAGVAQRRFGIGDDGRGVVYTRTGRRFFGERELENALLDRLDAALQRAGLWEELNTDWIVLDAELLPWSAKAQELLREQYAPTGAAATAALATARTWLDAAAARGIDVQSWQQQAQARHSDASRFVDAYRRYCWAVNGLEDLKIAPFHVLACEGVVGLERDHRWHLDIARRLADVEPLVRLTRHVFVDLADQASVADAIAWWEALTAQGGEGMVIKPVEGLARSKRGLVQPAIKCRGREYLRIIYGPEYTEPQNLDRLRQRGLRTKQSLAIREFALGLEALQRFVAQEPLYRVHECVFGVLALESEPVDVRL
ncbi:polynucleotide kinase-phosphatase [Xanthomonas sacchari]|uniref:polynucleotide kinase-phosphatase n=1 Tax=Xanthomonas sacchari TaxID=56458 RepID=UPI00225A0F3A|nr:polynucleotide kinase-phosphatase [Xanthomonas sacchari]MCW0454172.1 Bis(5'-nucleosyl)-tetraphosphatase, symmetrical [Xanthomonas sacchari]